MIGGAVLNNAAFTGNGKAALEENMQPQKALEDYQAATCMLKYTHNCSMLLDWIESNREIKEQAKQDFTNTYYAFKLYNQTHQDWQISPPKEPRFSNIHQPSKQQ